MCWVRCSGASWSASAFSPSLSPSSLRSRGCRILAPVGLVAALWAEKFDQLAAFQNFVIVPLTFLSGVFYSIHTLPPFWQSVSPFNPFFYMIDGFRYGFFGLSDVAPLVSLAIVGCCSLVLSALALALL